jgi:Putative adipose-regulatory protein (Seipin)
MQDAVMTALQNASVPHSKERFLPPGEQFTLWLELQLPDTSQYDIFQVQCPLLSDDCSKPLCVRLNMEAWKRGRARMAYCLHFSQAVGELRSVDGRLAAKSSRPVLPKPRPAVVALARSIATLPLAAVGLWHEYSKMQASVHCMTRFLLQRLHAAMLPGFEGSSRR